MRLGRTGTGGSMRVRCGSYTYRAYRPWPLAWVSVEADAIVCAPPWGSITARRFRQVQLSEVDRVARHGLLGWGYLISTRFGSIGLWGPSVGRLLEGEGVVVRQRHY